MTRTRAFVDGVEAGRARLIAGEQVFHLPVALLPEGAGEGAWVEIAVAPAAPPDDDSGARRRKLSQDDDGGGLAL
jgi:hypothetical protein